MKKLAMIVFVALALAAAPTVSGPPTRVDVDALNALEGRGLWGCSACLGSFVGLSTMGFGAAWYVIMGAGDGYLATRCVSACTSW